MSEYEFGAAMPLVTQKYLGRMHFTIWQPFRLSGNSRRIWRCDCGFSIRAFGNMYALQWVIHAR